MAITVRELLTKWSFDTNTKPIESLNKSIKDVKTTITLIGAQAIASAGALFGLANSVAKTGDDFAKTASRIGINVETLQEYSHVAKLAGSSTDGMNKSLEDLTLSISEAKKGGGKLIEPLIRLNQLTGRDLLSNLGSADDTMLKLADTFAQMTDETEKAELASKIFGGTGLEMVNILNQGSSAILQQRQEARDLGIVLSQKAAKQSEIFQDSLLRMKAVITGIKNTIGIELIPVITEFMDSFKDWISLNKDWIKSNINKIVRGMIDNFKKVIDLGRKISRVMGAMIRTFGGLENVIKTVTFALGLFTGIKFLSAIGNMTIAIGSGLRLAIMSMGNSALIAQAKIFLIPLAIGAAVAALFLIFDDLKAFFEGRDSITGKIIESLEGVDIVGILKEKFDGAKAIVKQFADDVSIRMASLFDFGDPVPAIEKFVEEALVATQKFFSGLSFDNFGERIGQILLDVFTGDSLTGSILGFFVEVFEGIGNVILTIIGGIVSGGLDIIKGIGGGLLNFSGEDGIISKGFDGAKSFFGFRDEESDTSKNLGSLGIGAGGVKPTTGTPNLKLLQGGQSSSATTNITNQNQVTVPVNLPQGVTSQEGSSMVQKGISDALNSLARETQAATATNVER